MTSQHISCTGSIPGAVALVITAVSMGVSVPTVDTPLCTGYATGLGPWNASVPRLRRRAQMTRISYEFGQLGASPENAVQDRN